MEIISEYITNNFSLKIKIECWHKSKKIGGCIVPDNNLKLTDKNYKILD